MMRFSVPRRYRDSLTLLSSFVGPGNCPNIFMRKKEDMTAFGRIALAILAISLAGLSVAAQEAKITKKAVPSAVLEAFKAAYPNATIKGYARERENGKTFYEIESKDGDVGRDILYNSDGTVSEIEETVKEADLPSATREVIRSKYPGAVVMKAEKITQGGTVGYEVVAKKGKKRIALKFDADGNLKAK